MRKIFLSVALLSTSLSMVQAKTIRGQVRDDKEAIPFANVTVKEDPTAGTMTDMDGNYEIEVSDGQTLEFSFAGYETKTVKVSSIKSSKFDVTLSVPTIGTELVVIGYGVVKKSDLTGGVVALNESKLKEGVKTSIDQALAGRAAGVSVTSSSGMPGQATSVRIHGLSSLSGSGNPLYVVDGMPIGGGDESKSASSNPLASINPADIVSMEILKDASATAIYGSRAANGVVMITTRKGKAGEAKITYDGTFTVSQFTKRYDMLNLTEYVNYISDPYLQQTGAVTTPDELFKRVDALGEGTNWQDELFRLGIGHTHQISASGGDEKTQYSISMGYTGQNGIIQNTDYNRINGRVNLESQIKSWMKMGMNVGVTRQNKTSAANILDLTNSQAQCYSFKEMDESVIIQTLCQLPLLSPYGTDGNPMGPDTDEGVKMNPIAELQQSPIERTENNILGTTFVDFTLLDKTVDGNMRHINWRNEFGVDITNANDELFRPSFAFGALKRDPSATELLSGNYRNNSIRFSSYVNWMHDFNKANHLTTMVGAELNKYSYEGTVEDSKGFDNNEPHNAHLASSTNVSSYFKGSGSMASWFARLNYNLKNQFLITATGRFDGSSNFAPGNRWGFFPSLGLAWRVDQMEFAQNSESFKKKINNFKVRAGWGQTGNASCQPAHEAYLTSWPTNETVYGYQMYVPGQYTNPNLTWETNTQFNLAVDLGFKRKDNKGVNLTIDGYYKKNKDLLLKQELPLYVAQNNWLCIASSYVNAGSIQNAGFDVQLSALLIKKEIKDKTFSWDSELTFSLVRSKVLDLGAACEAIYDKSDDRGPYRLMTSDIQINKSVVDEAPGKFWGYTVEGVIKDEKQAAKYNKETGRSANVGDLMFSKDMTWIGDPNPDFTAGWSNTFAYGPWSLNVQFNSSYGNDVFNLVRMKLEAMNGDVKYFNQSKEVLNHAVVEKNSKGQLVVRNNTELPTPSKDDANGNCKTVSDRYVEDGSYLRLQNVGVTYTFDNKVNEKLHISGLHVTAGCQNVCTITGYSGYDPENPGSAIRQGVDEARYPTPRTYSLGLGFSF